MKPKLLIRGELYSPRVRESILGRPGVAIEEQTLLGVSPHPAHGRVAGKMDEGGRIQLTIRQGEEERFGIAGWRLDMKAQEIVVGVDGHSAVAWTIEGEEGDGVDL